MRKIHHTDDQQIVLDLRELAAGEEYRVAKTKVISQNSERYGCYP